MSKKSLSLRFRVGAALSTTTAVVAVSAAACGGDANVTTNPAPQNNVALNNVADMGGDVGTMDAGPIDGGTADMGPDSGTDTDMGSTDEGQGD